MPRPTAYGPAIVDQLVALLRAGATEEYACAAVRPPIVRRTFYTWKTRHPEFAEEVKAAKEYADSIVQLSLFRSATGRALASRKPVWNRQTGQAVTGPDGQPVYEDTYFAPSPVSMIFWLKNRQPDAWKDRVEVDPSDKPLLVEIVERSAAPDGE